MDAEILKALIAPMTGLIGAFGGAYLTDKFAKKRWQQQIESDREKERRNILRVKGEEFYLALKKWEKELFFMNASRIGYLQGTVSEGQMNKNIDTKVNPNTHGQMDAIVALYFPEFTPKLDLIHKQVALVSNIYASWHLQYLKNAGAERMISEAAIYERQIEHLLKALRIRIKDI